jgi:hypothetical protein
MKKNKSFACYATALVGASALASGLMRYSADVCKVEADAYH